MVVVDRLCEGSNKAFESGDTGSAAKKEFVLVLDLSASQFGLGGRLGGGGPDGAGPQEGLFTVDVVRRNAVNVAGRG